MNTNSPTPTTIPFFDHADQQEGFFTLRTSNGLIAIGTSLRNSADTEPLITPGIARQLAKRILEITDGAAT